MRRDMEEGARMDCWMKRLARQHRIQSGFYPDEKLIVVFDIDDTILDLRHMVLHVLSSFDDHHRTRYFGDIGVQDIEVGELGVLRMMVERGITERTRLEVSKWFREVSWSASTIRDGHRPFPGVMDVIGWLQTRGRTFVGLNTGRPERMRKETLQCLNEIGGRHGVFFHDSLLFMNPNGWGEAIVESKVTGIGYFRAMGFRVIAFVDNEPENLEAVARIDRQKDILLLHADTVYTSGRELVPAHAVSGKVYDSENLAA
jgi:hypothetical protein